MRGVELLPEVFNIRVCGFERGSDGFAVVGVRGFDGVCGFVCGCDSDVCFVGVCVERGEEDESGGVWTVDLYFHGLFSSWCGLVDVPGNRSDDRLRSLSVTGVPGEGFWFV